nr:preprotein translocase subunit SecE [Actinomycetales bacterium]
MSESAAGRPSPRSGEKRGIFARIALFFRQIIAELKKVVRPSRNELWTYFVVVMIFVLAVMAIISALDFVFGQLVLLVFGT